MIVTAEYNCSLPPALTNLLDYFPPASFRQISIDRIFTNNIKRSWLSFRHKPVSIAAYSMGPFGGIRAAQLARCKNDLCLLFLPVLVILNPCKLVRIWLMFTNTLSGHSSIWYSPYQAVPLRARHGASTLDSDHSYCPGSKSLLERYKKLKFYFHPDFAECQHPWVRRGCGQREGDEEHGEDLQGARLVRGRPWQPRSSTRTLPNLILPIYLQ